MQITAGKSDGTGCYATRVGMVNVPIQEMKKEGNGADV